MLKNVRVKFINGLEGISINKGDNLLVRSFHSKNRKIFFVEDTYTDGEYIGMGLKKDGDFYEAVPIWIVADENGSVKEMKTLEEGCADLGEGAYFAYWKDAFKTFVAEIAGKVEYDTDTLLAIFTEILRKHEGHAYCCTDGKSSRFSFQILDQFEFIGQVKCGKDNLITISNITLRDRYEKTVITKLPDIKTDKIIEQVEDTDKTIEELLCNYLDNLTRYEMADYILSTISA